jgi:hypothetical protein
LGLYPLRLRDNIALNLIVEVVHFTLSTPSVLFPKLSHPVFAFVSLNCIPVTYAEWWRCALRFHSVPLLFLHPKILRFSCDESPCGSQPVFTSGRCFNPYLPYYRKAFAFSTISYPRPFLFSLRSAYPASGEE